MTEKILKALKSLNEPDQTIIHPTRLLSGFYGLDYALRGGLPRGHAVEISGPAGVGKTTMAFSAAAAVSGGGGRVLFVAAEKNYNTQWMQKMGIDAPAALERLEEAPEIDARVHFYAPPYLERALDVVRYFLQLDLYDLIIIDSIGGAPTKAEVDVSFEETQMTQLSRLGHKVNRVLPSILQKSKAVLMIINQIVTNMDYSPTYPNRNMPWNGQYISKGAAGWQFFFTTRIALERAVLIFSDKEPIGKEIKGMVFKSRFSNVPARFSFWLKTEPQNQYIDYPVDIRETALACGILEQRGAHWYYKGQHIAKSKEDCERWIQEEGMAMEQELSAHLLALSGNSSV